MLKHIESDLNEWLVPMYGDDLKLKYLVDDIPAITERRRMIYDNVITAVDKGIITRNEARERLGLEPITGGDEVYIPANLFPLGSETPQAQSADDVNKFAEEAYGTKEEIEEDVFTTEEEAEERSEEIGCIGYHSMTEDGKTIYMPCETHEEYNSLAGSKQMKALSFKPTSEMASNAKQALNWRKEFNRGGTAVGSTRATQLVNKENLSARTVLRMYSFFSRHEVDKQAQGFRSGEKGFPSAGRIAWGLWGGDEGFAWSKRKRNEIMKDKEKNDTISLQTARSEDFSQEGIPRGKPTSQKLRKAN